MSKFKLIIPKQKVNRPLPVNFKPKDSYLFLKEFSRDMPNLLRYSYKNININSNEYLWKNFKFLEDTFFRREFRRKKVFKPKIFN